EGRNEGMSTGAASAREQQVMPEPPAQKCRERCFRAGAAQAVFQRALEVALDYRGMDIALAAYRLCIAQGACDRFDGRVDVAARLGLRGGLRCCAQSVRRKQRPRPRAEVLAGELLARDLLQVSID